MIIDTFTDCKMTDNQKQDLELAQKCFPLEKPVVEIIKLVKERETLVLGGFLGDCFSLSRIIEIDDRLEALAK